MKTLATALTILVFVANTMAQYGPASLLSGSTNSIPTNYVFTFPSTTKISLGQYNTLGLHFELRTISSPTTNGVAFALRRSLDGLTYESNLWKVLEIPLNASSAAAGLTNIIFTNLTVGPFLAVRFDWMSNMNANAYGTNCVTNITLKYLLKN